MKIPGCRLDAVRSYKDDIDLRLRQFAREIQVEKLRKLQHVK